MRIYETKTGGIVEEIEPRLGGIQNLEEVRPNTVDAAVEKHVPVIQETAEGIVVKVGAVAHPMEPEHYIMWIAVEREGEMCRKYLKPGDTPQASFNWPKEGTTAYIYCNLHGLWKSD